MSANSPAALAGLTADYGLLTAHFFAADLAGSRTTFGQWTKKAIPRRDPQAA
jgi:hypothetical protein